MTHKVSFIMELFSLAVFLFIALVLAGLLLLIFFGLSEWLGHFAV